MTAAPTIIYVPIPLEGNRVAQVQMPDDLTKDEAEKIARVVVAMASEFCIRDGGGEDV